MDIETAREYCLSKKAVTECFPFDEYSLVMKVMNKMFALIDLESANKICLKCDPEYALRTAGSTMLPSKVPITSTKSTGTRCSLTVTSTTN